jgi:ADP-heptose:LPS heptosyltransferase
MGVERLLRGGRRVDAEEVKSVLVLEYLLPLGCCVHLTPVYEALKVSRPELTVMVATRGLGAALLRHNPRVDRLIETPDALTDTFGAARFLRAELGRLGVRPDCVLTGASDQRSRVALLGMLASEGWRGGYSLLKEIYERPLEYDKGRSLIDNNLRLAGLVGCGEEHREPKVYFSVSNVAVAEGLVREVNPEGRPLLVVVTQSSGGQRTRWHDERWVEVIRYAKERLGCCVVYVGTGADAAAVEELRAKAGVGASVAGRTSVTELAALVAMSDWMVSVDTGTMHVGRAVGVPMVVIGPSWQRPIEWLPLGLAQARILRGKDRDDVPEGYRLDEVEAEAVLGALKELVGVYPPSAGNRAARLAAGASAVDHRV